MTVDSGKKQFNVYLPPELIRDLKHHAVDVDQSLSEVVAQALTAWLSLHESRAGDRHPDSEPSQSRVT